MPNLIHSLDAASLGLFCEIYFKDDNRVNNFYAIHDCFAVTADNVTSLLSELKSVYIFIYCNNNYLEKLDNEIINSIKNMYGENQFNNKNKTVIHPDGRVFDYPDIKSVIDGKIDKNSLLKSSYILH